MADGSGTRRRDAGEPRAGASAANNSLSHLHHVQPEEEKKKDGDTRLEN